MIVSRRTTVTVMSNDGPKTFGREAGMSPVSSRWPALMDELEASVASLRGAFERTLDASIPPAADRQALERSLDRYQRAAASVTGYLDDYLQSVAPRPRR
jgi:hypothetical protein